MKKWIYALVGLLPFPLDKGARWIADRIYSPWIDGVHFAKWIKGGVARWRDKYLFMLDGLRTFYLESFVTLRWIIITEIPRRLTALGNAVIGHLTSLVNSIANGIISLVSNLRKWAEARVNSIVAFINDLVDWISSAINSIRDGLSKLLDRVFNVWATPGRLAQWIIGALWGVFLAHLYQQRERIARWFLNSSGAFTVWLAKQIESILVRLL